MAHLAHHLTLQNFLIFVNAIGTVCTMVVFFWSRLPKARKDWYEKNAPRFANAMRFLAAIFSDIMKAKRAYGKIKDGKVWRETKEELPSTSPVAVTTAAAPLSSADKKRDDDAALQASTRHREESEAKGEPEVSGLRVSERTSQVDDTGGRADRRDGQTTAGDASIFDED